MGCRWKSQNRKNVYPSPYGEEPLNSKVIKSFVPELRSRQLFSCFGCSMYICYEHSMYVSQIRIMGMLHSDYCLLADRKRMIQKKKFSTNGEVISETEAHF